MSDTLISGLRKFHSLLKSLRPRNRDKQHDTRYPADIPVVYSTAFNLQGFDPGHCDRFVMAYLLDRYTEHRFDLLGSGWVSADYGSIPAGFNGIKYYSSPIESDCNSAVTEYLLENHHVSSLRIRSHISPDYIPIDWQRDFISGYRWSQTQWYRDIRYRGIAGADIKIPLELSRFNHALQLAVSALVLGKDKRKLAVREYKDQILDYIAQNPPRMGVTWMFPINVAIRVCNLTLSFELLRQNGLITESDSDFQQIFYNSVYEHMNHLIENTEHDSHMVNNHYLAELAGIIFSSCFLFNSLKAEAQEIFSSYSTLFKQEILRQFHPDGGNFEASTYYHKFSSGIVIPVIALISGVLNQRTFTVELSERLASIQKFTQCITDPCKEDQIIQIGDTDSGHLLKLTPAGNFIDREQFKNTYCGMESFLQLYPDEYYWDTNHLDPRPLLSMFAGLGLIPPSEKVLTEFQAEFSLIRSLSNQDMKFPADQNCKDYQFETESISSDYHKEGLEYFKQTVFYPGTGGIPLDSELKRADFPDTGLFTFASKRLFLAVRAGDTGQHGVGGHGHNDKLSFCLSIDGIELAIDPGSYIYNPDIEKRNLFRSVKAHNVPVVDNLEQNVIGSNPFSLPCRTRIETIHNGQASLALKLRYLDIILLREFIIKPDCIKINDYGNRKFTVNINTGQLNSKGYGKLLHSNCLIQ